MFRGGAMVSLVLVTVLAVFAGRALSQELCAFNQCTNGEKCYNRNSAEGYVCECNMPFRDNYNCALGPDNSEVFTCYGSSCRSGIFASPNYPNNYPSRYRGLYLLYIPFANGITFTFNTPFRIENAKDELYIGSGLVVPYDRLNGFNSIGPDLLFFEGDQVPGRATLDNTDTAFLYFSTDKNMDFAGFSLQFRMVDGSPPMISNCPSDISQSTTNPNGIPISWLEPTATDADVVTSTATHRPGQLFPATDTMVTYIFRDTSGNNSTCSFTVTVSLLDREPPLIITTPQNITITVPFGSTGTTVSWNEPTAIDNSGSVFTSRTYSPGDFFRAGSTTIVTYTFADRFGNRASTSFSVTVIEAADNTQPIITSFPNDITINVPFGTTSAVVTWDEPTAFDNSGSVSQSSNFQSGTQFLVGSRTVTYTFTDPNGNNVMRSFNVNVVTQGDNERPVITTFPDDITVTVPFGSSGTVVNWPVPTASDNSGTVDITTNRPPGSSFTIGDTPVIYTFSDPSGNFVTRTLNVNVQMQRDTSRPVIVSFPDDITVTVPFGSAGTTVNWPAPAAFDNSGSVDVQSTRQPGSFFERGSTPIAYTFTDPSGNFVTRTFNVNIVNQGDNTPPTITSFPSDITVNVPFGSAGTAVTWDEPTSSDNSGSSTQTTDYQSGSVFPVGPTTVSYTFTDPNGNNIQRSFTITVIMQTDMEPPVIIDFPDDITITVPFGSSGSSVTWREPTAIDNSGSVITNGNNSPGNFFRVGPSTVTYTFIDTNGNFVIRSFNVNVVLLSDMTPPEITSFPSDIRVTVPFGVPGTTVTWTEPTSTDDSGTSLQNPSIASGSTFTIGITPVTYTFTDGSGNNIQQTFNVQVVQMSDNEPPSIASFPSDITISVPVGSGGTTVNWPTPVATDNSGTVNVDFNRAPGSFFPLGPTTVTYTFTDANGNNIMRSFTVNVTPAADNTPPIITSFPSDITVTVPFGTSGAIVTWNEPTSNDDSGTSRQESTIPSGSLFLVGNNPVTYTFTDLNGNNVRQTFTVNVIMETDMEPPSVTTFPSDITINIPIGTTSTVVTWPEPTARDNSGTVNIVGDRQSGSSFIPGTTPVTYTFTDPAGNLIIRSFNVRVVVDADNLPPVINTFPSDITVTVPFGTTSVPVTWDEPTSTDNSGSSFQSPSKPSGSLFPIGPTTVEYTFSDTNGNSIMRSFTVTVNILSDREPPVITSFPDDITIPVPFGTDSTPVSWQFPTATDNSGRVITETTNQPGSTFRPGPTVVTYTFTDPSGNRINRSFTVNVLPQGDGIPPVITSFPADITIQVPFGSPGVPVTWDEPTSTDNSGQSFQSSTIPSGSTFLIRNTPVVYTFTDANRNSIMRTLNVNVVELADRVPPVIISFPNDIIVNVPFGIPSTVVTWPNPTANDNSGTVLTQSTRQPGESFLVGQTPVDYTFTDPAGNDVMRTFNVIVRQLSDNMAPMITSFPSDITVTVPFGTSATQVTWDEPTSADNSGFSFQNPTRRSGSTFPVGVTPVKYTFLDPTGNSVEMTFSVTVLMLTDVERPEITRFPEDITVTVPFGTVEHPVNWLVPLATDNSGTVNIESSRAPGSSFRPGFTPVTYTFTDPAGNFVNRGFTVNVNVQPDETPPAITSFPSDITVTVPFGTPGTVVTWDEPTSTDNSGTSTQTSDIASGTVFPVGSREVTYTFTDPNGNSVMESFNVNVIRLTDNEDPMITSFPSDITIRVPFGVPGAVARWPEPTATDNSGTVNQRPSIPSGNTFTVGDTPVTYTFTDPAGNIVTRSFTVFVVSSPDDEPPQITTFPDDITVAVPFGTADTPVSWPTPTATDNAGTVRIEPNVQPGTRFRPGSTPVTYTFTDPNGNDIQRTFNVNVVVEADDTPPQITSFPSDITIMVPTGTQNAPVTWTEPTSNDDSGTSIQTPNIPSGTPFRIGSTPVTYTFTDANGNSVRRTFNVNVIASPDNEVPNVVSFPDDITVTVPYGTDQTPVNWPTPIVTDNSGTVNSIIDKQPGSLFRPGTTPVMYTFVDPNGNRVIRSFNVNVVVMPDDTPPEITSFPSDITVTVPFGTNSAPVTWDAPTSTDNSGTTFQSPSMLPGSTFNVGSPTPVTYTITDPTGNNVRRTFNVNVLMLPDDVRPSIVSTPQDIEIFVPFGTPGTNVDWMPPIATDNSGTVTPQASRDPGSFFPAGPPTRVFYTFTDPTGNNAQTSFEVKVTQEPDRIPPMITSMSEDITVTVPFQSPGVIVDWTEPTATDNSGSFTTTKTNEPGSFFRTDSVTPVTYTFTDAAGNDVRTSFMVRVVEERDTVSPMLVTCQGNITFTVLTGMVPVPVRFTTPTATDNSGNANLVLATKNTLDDFNAGRTDVEYRFEDNAGNRASCIFSVNIVQADPCSPEPCLNGAACVPVTLTSHTCICPDCFTGASCEIPVDACNANTCQNGARCSALPGSCTQYECHCPACYTGQFCQTLVDSCENHQCSNGALCTPSPNNCIEYTCHCPPCFAGRYCDIPVGACDNHACQNGAMCVASSLMPNSAYACSQYTCSCTGCFTGTRCELQRNACSPNPCLNNGLCSVLPDSCYSYTCQCQGCFTGFNCEIAIPSGCSSNPCLNGGVCNDIQGACGAYTCSCPDSFIGVNCQTPISQNPNPCNSFPCENGASCLTMDADHYICLCTSEFVGPNCLTPKANAPLLDACNSIPCANGADCHNSYNSNAGTNTAISQYACICPNGFTGTNCAMPTREAPELDICSRNAKPSCKQGAQCSNAYHSLDSDVDYHCACPVGFIGHNCDTPINNPCNSSPCKNGAACVPFNTHFMCECPTGLGGKTCENRIGDTIAPVISNCPHSMHFTVGDPAAQSVSWTIPTATDDSGSVAQVYASHQPNTAFRVGVTPVTYVFADLNQNYAQCKFYINVGDAAGDNIPPSVTNCPSNITVPATFGTNSAVVSWTVPTATDNSGAVNVRTTAQPGSSFFVGPTQVTYTFTDGFGNIARCIFTVTVTATSDSTPPTISNCPTNIIVPANLGTNSAVVSWNVPTATDNSGTVNVRTTAQPGSSFFVGPTQVTYTFTDGFGNFARCIFTVTVTDQSVDTTPPVISGCPMGATATAQSGVNSAQVTWTPPTAVDNSGGRVTVTSTHRPGDSFLIGSSNVNYTFTDPSGNLAFCSFVVLVNSPSMQDNIKPVISNCPGNIVTSPDPGSNVAIVSWVEPTATDNSGMQPGLSRSRAPPPATLPVNSITRYSYIFYDNSGNFETCIFTVTVTGSTGPTDTTPPVISNCPSSFAITAAPGASSAIVSWQEPTAVDNDGQTPSIARSHVPNTSFNSGPTPVTYVFSDRAGNQANCSFTVIVNGQNSGDNIKPVFVNCPENVVSYVNGPTSTASIAWTVPIATDNSGVTPTVTGTMSPPVNLAVGSRTATYTARDQAGNEATCNFTVSVILDQQAPTISNCPSNITQTLTAGSTAVSISWGQPTGTDNNPGPVTRSSTNNPGASFPAGNHTVVYTFIDVAGNQAVCSFAITVTQESDNAVNPCASSPCPGTQDCYYRPSPPEFLCLPRRNKRDAEIKQAPCLCENGGLCVRDVESVLCVCPANYTGILCEHRPLSIDHRNHRKESEQDDLAQFLKQLDYVEMSLIVAAVSLLSFSFIVLVFAVYGWAKRSQQKSYIKKASSLVY